MTDVHSLEPLKDKVIAEFAYRLKNLSTKNALITRTEHFRSFEPIARKSKTLINALAKIEHALTDDGKKDSRALASIFTCLQAREDDGKFINPCKFVEQAGVLKKSLVEYVNAIEAQGSQAKWHDGPQRPWTGNQFTTELIADHLKSLFLELYPKAATLGRLHNSNEFAGPFVTFAQVAGEAFGYKFTSQKIREAERNFQRG